MNRINTLRNLNGAAASTAATASAADESPEALAATLRQLACIVSQTGSSPLPSGTSIDWPVCKALSAAALLDGQEDDGNEDGAFRGPGRILGPMFDADQAMPSPTRRYSLRTRNTSLFASASSMVARRASAAVIEADAEAEAERETAESAEINYDSKEGIAEVEVHDDRSAWADDEDDEDDDNDDGTATPGETGTVMRDETQSDGTRKIEIQLRRSRGSVTLVIPQTPDADSHTVGLEASDTPHPGISFQLSPGFQLPRGTEADVDMGEFSEEVEEDDEDEEDAQPGSSAAELQMLLDRRLTEDDPRLFEYKPAHPLDSHGEEEDLKVEEEDSSNAHSYNGHRQPSAGRRIKQILAYLRSNYTIDDPAWHIHIADIEAYLDFLQPAPSSPQSQKERQNMLGPEAAQVAQQQACLDQALARLERDEMVARAEMDGRPADPRSVALYNSVHATRPPPILGARTLAMISECRSRLRRNADFYRQLPVERARVVGDDASQTQVQAAPGARFLQNLLATSGRSFAPRLALNARKAIPEQEDTHLGDLETHPFTVHMARYRRFRQHYMEEARILAEQEHGGDSSNPNWATLPPTDSIFSHGFGTANHDNGSLDYRQALPPHMERDRRLLQLLRGLNRQLLRGLNTAHRPLLDDIVKYAEQGLHGEPVPHGGLVLRDAYDIAEKNEKNDEGGEKKEEEVRPLAESEARWLQFLLSDSTNEQLARPLPSAPYMDEDRLLADRSDAAAIHAKAEEDGSCSLYYAFAHRFQALLDADASNPDGLFPTANARAPATAVVDAINRQSAAGFATHFSVYDGLHFLARLSKAGRCRFRHFPIDDSLGVVQRPLLTIHPEHRLHKSPRGADGEEEEEDHFEDDSIGAPRRSTEVDASWDDTIARPSARSVPAAFRRFFCCLAFRFGRTLRTLETTGRAQWKAYLDEEAARADADADTDADSGENDDQIDRMRTSIQIWRDTYDKLANENGNDSDSNNTPRSLRDVLRLAEPEKFRELSTSDSRTAPLTEQTAARYIRGKLVCEAAQGRTAPSRGAGVWDGAQPEIVGEAPPHYFHMDRWPLHLQTKSTAEQVRQGARVAMDPEIFWDPASEDPTPPEYLWTVSTDDRRYGFRRIERAETAYRLGDTALQRQVVVQDLTRRVAAAIGVPYESLSEQAPKPTGLLGWLGSKLGKRRRGGDGEDDEEDEEGIEDIDFEITELPKARKILKGFDWTELTTRNEGVDEDVDDEEDDEVDAAVDDNGLSEAAAWTDEDDQELIRELCSGA